VAVYSAMKATGFSITVETIIFKIIGLIDQNDVYSLLVLSTHPGKNTPNIPLSQEGNGIWS